MLAPGRIWACAIAHESSKQAAALGQQRHRVPGADALRPGKGGWGGSCAWVIAHCICHSGFAGIFFESHIGVVLPSWNHSAGDERSRSVSISFSWRYT